MGVAAFLEVGPGKVLSGLLRRIDRDAVVAAFCAPVDLNGVRALPGWSFLLNDCR
jgi:malonyl CoA-acyl carrier protein transacylase